VKNNPIVTDKMPELMKALKLLAETEVLVGIPASAGLHPSPEGSTEPITNAQIGYIMENGSPANNVPARPFLVPGVRDARADVVASLRSAAEAAFTGKPAGVTAGFTRAGLMAENAVKAKINSNIAPALSPETIARRNQARKTKSVRKSEKDYGELVNQGFPAADVQDAVGIVALVNTGALRNSVTHVVKKKGG
jgi:hypothetical protein